MENKHDSKPDTIDVKEVKNVEKKEEKKDTVHEDKIQIIEEKVNKNQAIYDKLMKEKQDFDDKLKRIKQKREEVNDRLNAALKQKALKDKERGIEKDANEE